jgi:DNA (cytosine-5)-methyltransferase 1
MQVVELFAGVGGFRLGLEASGHEVIWSNQWEPKIQAQHASDCYVDNFGDENHSNVDINEVEADEIPDHDLLVGGFPCQDYSVAQTNAKGIEGEKGVLWWEIERILRAKRPDHVLLENVNRLLRSPTDQRGRDFGVLLHCMTDLGYSVEWRMINAADYGYATRRRRVFIFGAQEDTAWGSQIAGGANKPQYLSNRGFFSSEFPVVNAQSALPIEQEPHAHLIEDPKRTSDDFEFDFDNSGVMVGGEIWTERMEPESVEPTVLGDILETEGVGEKYFIDESDMERWEYLKGSKNEERTAANGHTYSYNEGAVAFPEPLDRPARTILTSEGTTSPSREKHAVTDPATGRLRILTPEEVERIMGFPSGWTESIKENWRYTTMGNALVVGLVEQMGQVLQEGPAVVSQEQPDEVGALGYDD